MAVFAEANQTFASARTKLQATKSKLVALRTLIDDLVTALRVGERLDSALRRIGDSATVLRRLLNAMRVPPAGPWGAAIRAIKEAIEQLLRAVDTASDAAARAMSRLDDAMASIRRRLQRVSVSIRALERSVDEAIAVLDHLAQVAAFLETQQDLIEELLGPEYVQQLRNLLAELRTACRTVDDFNSQLDDISARLTPLVDQLRGLIDEINALADQVEQVADQLESAATQVSNAWASFLSLLNRMPQWVKDGLARFNELADWVQRQLQPYIDDLFDLLDQAGITGALNDLRNRVADAIDPLTDKAQELIDRINEVSAIVDDLTAQLNAARSSLDEFMARLRTLEGMLAMLAVLKLLLEHYLRMYLDELEKPLSELEDGALLVMLESGDFAARVESMTAVHDRLGDAMKRLGSAPALLAPSPVRVRQDPEVEGLPVFEFDRARDAHARASAVSAEMLTPIIAPLRAIDARFDRTLRKLRGVVSAPGAARPEDIKPLLADLRGSIESAKKLPLDAPAGIKDEFFGAAAALVGLPPMEALPRAEEEAKDWAVTVLNDTGKAANDLHLVFAFTGGSLTDPRVLIQPDGCPPPTVGINPGNQVNIVWASACIQVGDTVVVAVKSKFVPIQLVGTTWTLDGEALTN